MNNELNSDGLIDGDGLHDGDIVLESQDPSNPYIFQKSSFSFLNSVTEEIIVGDYTIMLYEDENALNQNYFSGQLGLIHVNLCIYVKNL